MKPIGRSLIKFYVILGNVANAEKRDWLTKCQTERLCCSNHFLPVLAKKNTSQWNKPGRVFQLYLLITRQSD